MENDVKVKSLNEEIVEFNKKQSTYMCYLEKENIIFREEIEHLKKQLETYKKLLIKPARKVEGIKWKRIKS
jgi:hypothetical protein